LQDFVGRPIPQRKLGELLGMKPLHVGDVLDALEAKDYIQLRKPSEWKPDGSWKEATKLVAIRKHPITHETPQWINLPAGVVATYGRHKATSLRLRLHALQMLEQR